MADPFIQLPSRFSMPELLIPKRKPVGAVKIDNENFFAHGLQFFTLCDALFPTDLISNKKATLTDNSAVKTIFGIGINGTELQSTRDAGNDDLINWIGLNLDTTKGVKFFWQCKFNTSLSWNTIISLVSPTENATLYGIGNIANLAVQLTFNRAVVFANNTALDDGLYHSYFVQCYNDGTNRQRLYRDGIFIEEVNNLLTVEPSYADIILTGQTTDPNESLGGNLPVAAVWNGEIWSDVEVSAFINNPYQFLIPYH